jgi:hypothetical protein
VSTLLVAATGGHLSELVRLAPRLDLGDEPTWVTFDTPQSRELLEGRDVVHAHYTKPRDFSAVARNTPLAIRLLRRRGYERVISTGPGIALSFLPQAAALRRETHYVESLARAVGPSVTGRALQRVPGVRLYTQYPGWARGRWSYAGSVLDSYAALPGEPPSGRPLRVALSVGTIFPFPRLADRLAQVLGGDAEVLLWQTADPVPPAELRAAFREADAVVTHAGVGAALEALEAGRRPLLVPRLARHGEHVDDHQLQVAGELERRGLAVVRQPEDLTIEDLREAASGGVETVADPPPLDLR